MNDRWIFWDFDGTLANRSAGWTTCLLDVVTHHYPEIEAKFEAIRLHMSRGFPWHTPEKTHHELSTADAWWDRLFEHLNEVLDLIGCPKLARDAVMRSLRQEYVDGRRFEVVPGARETLAELTEEGWKHLVVSNHVPELPRIVASLGLDVWFEDVLTSAAVGAEKPHRAIFEAALEVGRWPATVWMVGDSLTADVQGALRAGLRAVFVGAGEAPCPVVSSVREVVAVVSADFDCPSRTP